jgi:hypothetical protein
MSTEKDFIHEVDEDVRADRLLKWWRSYSRFFYGFVIALLLIVGIASGYKRYRLNQSMELADRYTSALELLVAEKYEEGLLALEAIEQSTTSHTIGYAVMAKLQRAAYMLKRQKESSIPSAEIIQIYWDLSNNASYPSLYRDFGTYLTGFYSLQHEYADIPKDEIIKRLHKMAESTHASRLIALELLAHYQKKDGHFSEARKTCQAVLDDPTKDQGALKERCKALLASLPAEEKSNEEKKEEPKK